MELLKGIEAIAYAFGAFAVVYLANMIFGVVSNCIVNGDRFEFKRIFVSICKVLVAAFMMFAVTIGFNLFGMAAEYLGAEIKDAVLNVISLLAYALLFAKGFAQTAVDVYEKIRDLFSINDKTTFDREKIAELTLDDPAEFESYETEFVGVGGAENGLG